MTRMQAAINGIAAAEFREAISEKTRDGQRHAFEQGFHVGGKVYGYNICTTTVQFKPGHFRKLWEVNEQQAAIVRREFELYANGASPRSIAARFNDEGIPSPGADWDRAKRRSDGKWLASTRSTSGA
jgi:site-specific DNA recombinase